LSLAILPPHIYIPCPSVGSKGLASHNPLVRHLQTSSHVGHLSTPGKFKSNTMPIFGRSKKSQDDTVDRSQPPNYGICECGESGLGKLAPHAKFFKCAFCKWKETPEGVTWSNYQARAALQAQQFSGGSSGSYNDHSLHPPSSYANTGQVYVPAPSAQGGPGYWPGQPPYHQWPINNQS
jgi:hypothetical protein